MAFDKSAAALVDIVSTVTITVVEVPPVDVVSVVDVLAIDFAMGIAAETSSGCS